MSNGARHGLGVVIGLVVTPVIAACLMYGTQRLGQFARTFDLDGSGRWIGAAVMLAAAVLIGLVAGSRVSPLASLVPGAVFTVIGALWIVAPRWAFLHSGRDLLPSELGLGYVTVGPFGIFLLVGVGLLIASLAPSRWQARTAAPRFGGMPPAPMGSAHMHGSAPHMGAPQPPQAPPGPGQSPSWQGAPQYGQQPAQPAASNPPPLPSGPPASPSEPPAREGRKPSSESAPDEDGPGEWTQMYGGNRPT